MPMWRWYFYNRSSAVSPLRNLFIQPHFGGFCDAPHVGAYQWMAVLSMGDVDSWQEVFMQNYSCGDCFEVMAFRYFFL